MTGRLKSNRKGWDQLKKRLLRFDQRQIDVGFFKKERYGPENDNLYVAEVAWMNDHGTSQVPSRPFLTVDFVEFASNEFKKRVEHIFHQLLFKKNVAFLKELDKIGQDFSGELKTIIYDYPGSNSDRWIDVKGFDDPLYHTGEMVNAVDYRIKRGSE